MNRIKTNKEAFSIVETLAAAFVFSIIAAGIMLMMSSSSRQIANSRINYSAQMLARETLEVLTSFSYEQLKQNKEYGIANYRFDQWIEVDAFTRITGVERPEESCGFEKKITLIPLENATVKSCLIQVQIRRIRSRQIIKKVSDIAFTQL